MTEKGQKEKYSITSLLKIKKTLRDPDKGCRWDQKQTLNSIIKYTIEEVYEVKEAIEKDRPDLLKDALGDLLFQIIFYCQISDENKNFNLMDVVDNISRKMKNRHPHVFSNSTKITLKEQQISWENLKAVEKNKKKGTISPPPSMDGVINSLPALMRSLKLQKNASKVGFDWPEIAQVYDKVIEELNEIKMARTQNDIEEEIDDLSFSVVNLARHLGTDPEKALRRSNLKFEKRFRNLENKLFCEKKVFQTVQLKNLKNFGQ